MKRSYTVTRQKHPCLHRESFNFWKLKYQFSQYFLGIFRANGGRICHKPLIIKRKFHRLAVKNVKWQKYHGGPIQFWTSRQVSSNPQTSASAPSFTGPSPLPTAGLLYICCSTYVCRKIALRANVVCYMKTDVKFLITTNPLYRLRAFYIFVVLLKFVGK